MRYRKNFKLGELCWNCWGKRAKRRLSMAALYLMSRKYSNPVLVQRKRECAGYLLFGLTRFSFRALVTSFMVKGLSDTLTSPWKQSIAMITGQGMQIISVTSTLEMDHQILVHLQIWSATQYSVLVQIDHLNHITHPLLSQVNETSPGDSR